MGYRPICDIWLLARPKVSYYGAYPAGFLSRARDLLGVGENGRVLHVCSGKVKEYPYRGFGKNDKTLDIDSSLNPDYCQDALTPLPAGFDSILCDPPYTEDDAQNYNHKLLPDASRLLRNCLDALPKGGRVGFLHYLCPRPPKGTIFVACVGVLVGFGNRIRVYSVFEKG